MNIYNKEGNYNSYITSNTPDKFGGKQEDYIERIGKIVKNTIVKIKEAIQNGDDLQQLFLKLVDELGEERHQIALAHNTSNADDFGRRRDRTDNNGKLPAIMGISHTVLIGDYEKYGKEFLKKISGPCRNFLNSNTEQKIKGKYTSKKFTLNTSITFRIHKLLEMTDEEKSKTFFFPTLPKLVEAVPKYKFDQDLLKIVNLSNSKENINKETKEQLEKEQLDKIIYEKKFLQDLKTTNIEIYNTAKQSCILNNLAREFPNPIFDKNEQIMEGFLTNFKDSFPIVILRVQLNNIMVALSQLTTFSFLSSKKDPIKRMLNYSKVVVTHQDVFFIEDMLKHCASFFKQAILWEKDQEDIADLVELMGLLHYYFAQSCPYCRGSASIAEVFGAVIAGFHGFENFHYNSEHMVDMKAITSLLDEFMQRYSSMIHLE